MTSHHHPAAEMGVIGVESGECTALVGRKQSSQDSAALRVEIGGYLRPGHGLDAGGYAGCRHGADGFVRGAFHGANLANRMPLRHPISENPTASSPRTR